MTHLSLWLVLAPEVGQALKLNDRGQEHTGVVRRVRVHPGGGGLVEFVDGHRMEIDPLAGREAES